MEKLAILGGEPAVSKELSESVMPPGSKTGYSVNYPIIEDEEINEVIKVLKARRFCIHTSTESKGLEFGEKFAEYIGVKHAYPVNSGTAAIHCALAASGIGPGDEVITSAYSFISSAHAILHHNAIPVFADIDPRTYCLDPEKVQEKISPKTKAILAVHIHGHPADMKRLKEITDDNRLTLIEDAAQAHGAEYEGKKVGGLGDMGCFSLQESKNMTCGEGGIFTTDDNELFEKACQFTIFGKEVERRKYLTSAVSWNYKMHELASALGLAQLKRLDQLNEERIKNADYLSKRLNELEGIDPPYVAPTVKHVFYVYTPMISENTLGISRDLFVDALRAEGVPAGAYQEIPIYSHPIFQDFSLGYGKGCPFLCPFYDKKLSYANEKEECPNTEQRCKDLIIFYIHPPLNRDDMKQFSDAIAKVIDNIDQLK